MALNTSGIISNVKAQSQKIYKTVKGNLKEDGLLSNSLNKALDSVSSKAKDGYDDVVKGINVVKKDMPSVPNDPEQLLKDLQGISKDKDGTIAGIGKQMTEEQAEKVKEAAAMRMVKKNTGLNSDDNMKTYEGVLRSTKGAVAGNTALNMGEQYFVQPIKDLSSAMKANDKSAAGKAIGKIATRSGAVVGSVGAVAGTGSILSNVGNDKDIMRY